MGAAPRRRRARGCCRGGDGGVLVGGELGCEAVVLVPLGAVHAGRGGLELHLEAGLFPRLRQGEGRVRTIVRDCFETTVGWGRCERVRTPRCWPSGSERMAHGSMNCRVVRGLGRMPGRSAKKTPRSYRYSVRSCLLKDSFCQQGHKRRTKNSIHNVLPKGNNKQTSRDNTHTNTGWKPGPGRFRPHHVDMLKTHPLGSWSRLASISPMRRW